MTRTRAIGPLLLVIVAGLGSLPVPAGAQGETPSDMVVTFASEGTAEVVLDAIGIGDTTAVTPLVSEITATPAEAAELRQQPGVVAVETPVTFRAAALPNDPCISGCGGVRTTYLESLGIPQAWEGSGGSGVEIAVIDGGVELSDPDLAGKVVEEIDYLGGAPGMIDHGTAVAALAAAATGDGVGIPGVARDAVIRSFRVVAANDTATESNVAAAVRDATDLGAKVINLSLGGGDSAAVHAEIDRSISLGVVVVAAAGNIDPGAKQDPTLGYPGRYPEVVAVGASTGDDQAASFSYRGAWVDVFAPGTDLAVPVAPGSGYASFTGTSGATPIVAGAVALLRAAQPGLTPAQISERLHSTSIPLGDGTTGERRVQVGSLVRGVSLPLPANGNPTGSLDVVSVGPGLVDVQGWALDPNTAAPIDVHVYVNDAGYASTASLSRPDVGTVLPGYGANHGFAATIPVSAGTRSACVYAIGVPAGANQLLGCRTIVVGGRPIGALDIARQVPGGVEMLGWSFDLDVAQPIDVHAYAGPVGVATRADGSRADIGTVFPAWGPYHGYSVTVPTQVSGATSVCAYGIDVQGGGGAILGCRTVELRQSPFGALDDVSRVGGEVRLRGWAIDPGTGAVIDVHVYVSGAGVAARGADLSRPDVAAAFPGYSDAHGYDVSVSAPPGAQICLYGINVGAGGNALLGCRTAP